MARAIVFDVNETLLDLGALRGPFAVAFGSAEPLGEWFARLLHASLVVTLTDTYEDFGTLGRRSLDALARRRGVGLPEEHRDAILGTMRRLPPHPEVPAALERLRSAGFPTAALTNSAGEVARAQLEYAGLIGFFDRVLSVDEVRRFKPAPEPYRMAAERLGVLPAELRLVAAHDWDVRGAIGAGCAGAYVARGGVPFVLGEPPEIVEVDLAEVVDAILRIDTP